MVVYNLTNQGPDIRTLMMEMRSISDMVVYLNHLMELSAQQEFNGHNVVTNGTNIHNRIYTEISATRIAELRVL
jgi:hypothetical protein